MKAAATRLEVDRASQVGPAAVVGHEFGHLGGDRVGGIPADNEMQGGSSSSMIRKNTRPILARLAGSRPRMCCRYSIVDVIVVS
jgi:hypothetical protein